MKRVISSILLLLFLGSYIVPIESLALPITERQKMCSSAEDDGDASDTGTEVKKNVETLPQELEIYCPTFVTSSPFAPGLFFYLPPHLCPLTPPPDAC